MLRWWIWPCKARNTQPSTARLARSCFPHTIPWLRRSGCAARHRLDQARPDPTQRPSSVPQAPRQPLQRLIDGQIGNRGALELVSCPSWVDQDNQEDQDDQGLPRWLPRACICILSTPRAACSNASRVARGHSPPFFLSVFTFLVPRRRNHVPKSPSWVSVEQDCTIGEWQDPQRQGSGPQSQQTLTRWPGTFRW